MKFQTMDFAGEEVQVAKYAGVGPLRLETSRGELKLWPGDHVVEYEYERPARLGDKAFDPELAAEDQLLVLRSQLIVFPEEAARHFGIWMEETVEQREEREWVEAQKDGISEAEFLAKREELASVPINQVKSDRHLISDAELERERTKGNITNLGSATVGNLEGGGKILSAPDEQRPAGPIGFDPNTKNDPNKPAGPNPPADRPLTDQPDKTVDHFPL